MASIKALAGQTAVYGLSSILGRVLNYFLVFVITQFFDPSAYGIVSDLYAYVAFFTVLLTYGMETTFFRFSSRWDDAEKAYSHALFSVISTSSIFMLLMILLSQNFANALYYPEHPEYITWFAIILGTDAISSIMQARLRQENKALHFAVVNLSSIFINIGVTLFFIALLKSGYDEGNRDGIYAWYDPEIGIAYVFIANLIASLTKFLLLSPYLFKVSPTFYFNKYKGMIIYAFPLLFAGLAGIVNEALDRILLKYMLIDDLGKEATLAQIGIYGACYKLSVLITLVNQAFRYAAEPFFFSQEKNKKSGTLFARIMKWYVILLVFVGLVILMYLDLFLLLIGESYRVGAPIIPILIAANIFLGIYYNLSVWFKLTDNTRYGAGMSIFGAIVTIIFNILLIPYLGYMGSAIATFACYFSMALLSYTLGRKHYPVPYEVGRIMTYLLLGLLFYGISEWFSFENAIVKYLVHTILIISFVLIVFWKENPVRTFKQS